MTAVDAQVLRASRIGAVAKDGLSELRELLARLLADKLDVDAPIPDGIRHGAANPRENLRAEDGEVDQLLLIAHAAGHGDAAAVPGVQERTQTLGAGAPVLEDGIDLVQQQRRLVPADLAE